MLKRLLPVLAYVALSCTNGSAQDEKMVAGFIRALKVDGDVWQIVGGSGQRDRLTEGEFVPQGNLVETAANGRVILIFQNGSTINLQPGTRMAVQQFLVDPFAPESIDYRKVSKEAYKSVTKVKVDAGTITAKVPKLNPSSSYDIAAPLGTAGIRGTVVTVSVGKNATTFLVTEGMIQVTKDGQSYWISEGADQAQEGDTRTGKEGSQEEETIVVSSDQSYIPSEGQIQNLTQQAMQFSENVGQLIPQNPFAGAPQDGAGSGGTTGDGSSSQGTDTGDGSGGGSGGGSAPALPGGFGGGGGGGGTGGGSSGGGSIYSN